MNIMNFDPMGGILKRGLIMLCLLVFGTAVVVHGQGLSKVEYPKTVDEIYGVNVPANGSGVMVAGQLWDSFQPANRGPNYKEANRELAETAIQIGNFDRQWSTPTHAWPGGWTNTNFWEKDLYIIEYNPDPNFNPPTIGGAANPSYYSTSGSNYAYASYANKPAPRNPPRVVKGAGDPVRDYYRETKWVDATKRHHALYEAGWPTTIGVDVKLEVHQYSLHWNGFNDFITLKFTLTNTGEVDLNADGVAEKTGNVIRALTMAMCGQVGMSARLAAPTAARQSGWSGSSTRRCSGYMGDNDSQGNPWDLTLAYPGESNSTGSPAKNDMGFNDGPLRFHTDVWSGWCYLGAKDATGNDKKTIYGTHPIGTGPQRGWYASSGDTRGFSTSTLMQIGLPRNTHTLAMATWYTDGGKSRSPGLLNLNPNPNFFASGTTGDPTSFVPKASPTRPNGDRKLLSEESPTTAFEEYTHEPGWTKGYTEADNFDSEVYAGIGPFSLQVGETMTITLAEAGGYRLQGIQNAIAAARYIYENGDDVAENYPAVPEMRVDGKPGTPPQNLIRWDNRAETWPSFAGYKIYRATAAFPVDWTKTGMRVMDDYWKNMTPGPTPDNLKQPMNPDYAKFDPNFTYVAGRNGVADGYGPYDLWKVIPKSALGAYASSYADPISQNTYNYAWADSTSTPLGFKFFYYVSAYTNQAVTLNSSWTGVKPGTTDFLETSNVNRNGSSGLWVNTYPYAYLNSDFPKTALGLKNIGAAITVQGPPVKASDLLSNAAKVSVRPNPYKKKALFDNALDAADHKVAFYNLPPKATITILDVSGQIVQVINFNSIDPNNGTTYWNLFSKTGVEVASGLYIYVVEYDGGKQVGYLAIMR